MNMSKTVTVYFKKNLKFYGYPDAGTKPRACPDVTCGGMLEALGILFEKQDFRARTPEKGIAAMDGGAIPVRPALITDIQNA